MGFPNNHGNIMEIFHSCDWGRNGNIETRWFAKRPGSVLYLFIVEPNIKGHLFFEDVGKNKDFNHSRPSTISRRLHICNRQGSSLQGSWSRLPNLLEHIPKKNPNKGNIFCYRMDTYMEYMETNGVILPLNHRQLSFLVSSWCSSGCMSWSSLIWWFPKSWGHPQMIQVIRPWRSMT